jgi:TolA-binding protein
MQSQDAAATMLFKLWPRIEANKNKIIGVTAIIAAAIVLFSFFSWWHEQNEIAASDALTQMVISIPPDAAPNQIADAYLRIAAEHSDTPAGERALLQGAAALFAEGKYADAQAYFQKFLDTHPDNEFSGQAALGVAKCLDARGKASDAVGAYQHVINDFADAQAVITAKFALAQLDEQQGNLADAARLYQEVARSDPYGLLGNEAVQYALQLRSKSSSTSPSTTPATPFNLSH